MDIKTVTEFKRLFLRESTNKLGERTLIGKVIDRSVIPFTDLIVVCNPDIMRNSSIDRVGRWDVEVKPMKSGKGFVVMKGEWAFDKVELSIENFKIQLLINGRDEKLKEGERFIPLSFDCRNFYEPKRVASSIRKKLEYMQLREDTNVDDFLEFFLGQCKMLEKEYKNAIKRGDE